MNEHDTQKERHEIACLNTAIRLGKEKASETGIILSMLDGTTVNRGKNDCPDIIRICDDPINRSQKICMGIEHFCVDQASVFKSGKSRSIAAEYKSHLEKANTERIKILSNGFEVSDDYDRKMANDSFGLAAIHYTTGYDEIIKAFDIALNHHLLRVPEYRRQLDQYDKSLPRKITFLIEIRCFLAHTFLNMNGNAIENKQNMLPMTDEIVDLLGKIDAKAVDYIVLLMINPIHPEFMDVIAFSTGNIADSLFAQGIPVYTVCLDPIRLSFSLTDTVKDEDGAYTCPFKTGIKSRDNSMARFIPGLQKAYLAQSIGKPFLATRGIQAMMYAFGDQISFASIKGETFLVSNRTQNDALQQYDEFVKNHQGTKPQMVYFISDEAETNPSTVNLSPPFFRFKSEISETAHMDTWKKT